MERIVRFSGMVFAALLYPTLFQVSCEPTGNTTLSSLELEVDGADQIAAFDPATRQYSVVLPLGTGAVLLRAQTTEAFATTTWSYEGQGAPLGTGGGEATISSLSDPSTLVITVRATGGAVGSYTVDVAFEGTDQAVPVVCSENAFLSIMELPYRLSVEPDGPVTASAPFTAMVSGAAVVPELVLDAMQLVHPGGIDAFRAPEITIGFQGRPPLTGFPVILTSAPASAYTCAFDGLPCNPANDVLTTPAPFANTDCSPTLQINHCTASYAIPTIDGTGDACAACNAINSLKADQCMTAGYCVSPGAEVAIPLAPVDVTIDAPATGDLLLGWDESVLPPVAVGTSPNRVLIALNGVFWRFDCYMGRDNGGVAEPLLDAELFTLPVLP